MRCTQQRVLPAAPNSVFLFVADTAAHSLSFSLSLSLSLSTPKKQEEEEEEADSGGTEPCVQQRSDQLHNNPAPCVARLLFFSFGFNSTVFFLVGYTAASSRTRQQHFPTVEMIRINWRERERHTKHRDRERENDRRQQRVIWKYLANLLQTRKDFGCILCNWSESSFWAWPWDVDDPFNIKKNKTFLIFFAQKIFISNRGVPPLCNFTLIVSRRHFLERENSPSGTLLVFVARNQFQPQGRHLQKGRTFSLKIKTAFRRLSTEEEKGNNKRPLSKFCVSMHKHYLSFFQVCASRYIWVKWVIGI